MKNLMKCLFCTLILLSSCTEDNITIEKTPILITNEELIGEWRSSNALINGQPLEVFTGSVFNLPNIVGFNEDQTYYFNYNSGEWKIEGNQITLENERDFKILSYEGDKMTLEAEIYESQTFWDLIGIESDELITITEDFYRR